MGAFILIVVINLLNRSGRMVLSEHSTKSNRALRKNKQIISSSTFDRRFDSKFEVFEEDLIQSLLKQTRWKYTSFKFGTVLNKQISDNRSVLNSGNQTNQKVNQLLDPLILFTKRRVTKI